MRSSLAHCLAAAASCLVGSLAACGNGDSSSGSAPPATETNDTNDAGGSDVVPLNETGADAAATIATGPSKGSPIALSGDESVLVVVNRDVGSVSIFAMTYPAGSPPSATRKEVDLGAGSEPWQVAIAPDGDTAFVVLRGARKLVKIGNLKTAPAKVGEVSTGSEPTGLALTPTGARAYVANWVDGTVVGVDTKSMQIAQTVDLNVTLAASGLVGTVAARPALAHPRSIAITNNGDATDDDETLYATEYFAQRIAPEAADGANADVSKAGQVYRVSVATGAASMIQLAPRTDVGFPDENGAAAGCFPNQLQSIAIAGHYAYVVSVCASPKGPTGPKVTATSCATVADCAGMVSPVCVKADSTASSPVCVETASVRTTTQPLVSVIDTTTNLEVPAATANLNALFRDLYVSSGTPDDAARRYPLVADDLSFVPGTSIGYVSANGADAVFRVRFDAASGGVVEVGSTASKFIDLAPAAAPAAQQGKNPVGIAVGAKGLLFSANDVSRNVSVVDLAVQGLVGGASAPLAFEAAARPAPGSDDERALKGKRFFNTGVGRWSLKGQAWGACQSCHMDGLTDNVTWYFARGPRQSTSLDGSFSKKDPTDRRIFNWTAIADELADFEGNVRGVSGGTGAIVNKTSAPPSSADRISLTSPADTGQSHAGLNGSSTMLADTSNPLLLPSGEQSAIDDWANMEKFVMRVRSPHAPVALDSAKVTAGRALFAQNNCQGCHGGDKWTISKVFWSPSPSNNAALKSASWSAAAVAAGFPSALMPASTVDNRLMRFDSGNPAGLDQIQCILRPVGTFGLAEADVGIAEKRVNMTATAQGNETDGKGYNPPSLLGLTVGAPYLHAGGARSLEALFADTFKSHHQSLSVNFLDSSDANAAEQRAALVQFLLSIDGEAQTVAAPSLGATGGNFCSF